MLRAFLTGPFGSWELQPGTSVLGRGEECSIRVRDPRLSRKHVQLLWDGARLVLRDLGSSNGTFLNGDPVQGEVPLKNQDILIVGPIACDVYIGEHSFHRMPSLAILPDGSATHPGADQVEALPEQPAQTISESHNRSVEPGTNAQDSRDPDLLPQSHSETPVYSRKRTEPLDFDAVTSLFPQNLPADNPEINNPTTKQALTSRRSSGESLSHIDPAIKKALEEESSKGHLVTGKQTTGQLLPDRSSVHTDVQALQPHSSRGQVRSVEVYAGSKPTPKVTTEVRPHNSLGDTHTAIEPTPAPRPGNQPRPLALGLVRLLAGLADSLSAALMTCLIVGPVLGCGFAAALVLAGAGWYQEAPHLHFTEVPASFPQILMSLLRSDGLRAVPELLGDLHAVSQQGFLVFFLSCVVVALIVMFFILLFLIAPTTRLGGPYWHRRCGLVIVEQRNGYHPTPLRSCVRWLLAIVLLPLSALAALCGLRAPHDWLSGCEVRWNPPSSG